ncbi:PTS fructose transporter subunit IIC [Cellulomonas endophytica]|uniref:PTS fructose transporter subunit IIC n=1 Tax=Cellulomonas endophytica TaxID=2494735 RepID=UPI0010128129|nr:PTS fructose transporter subunit IIBC [Cellulomonas endophytica]
MKFVAVSSCPTGIAHTYMAAEALEQAGRAAGHDVQVETQGSAGTVPLDPAVVAAADGVIYAADLEVRDKGRFAGKPFVDVGVKKAVHDAPGVLAQAVAAVEAAQASGAPAAGATPAPVAAAPARQVGVGSRIRQYLMTGVSYMIPFVAAGGILIALGFMLASVAWDENGAIEVTAVDRTVLWTAFEWGNLQHWAVLLFQIGATAFGFLVPALSAYIAYAIADRPGLVPGFVGGTLAGLVGAGFLGGIVTGFLAGFLALWLATRKVPKGVRGVMPVVVIPLVATLVTGALTILVVGPPMKAINDGLSSWLGGLGTTALVPLGIVLGLMMCFDLGGPLNKVAYVFATTGLANATSSASTEARIMAAVMAAGMVPPLAVALATTLRPKLWTESERESGKSAYLLGLSFISEGAIPFAAADPLRLIPSFMVGGAVTGGLTMAFGSGVLAPHGGFWVTPLISSPLLFLLALLVGTAVSTVAIVVVKSLGHGKDPEAADVGAEPLVAAR